MVNSIVIINYNYEIHAKHLELQLRKHWKKMCHCLFELLNCTM